MPAKGQTKDSTKESDKVVISIQLTKGSRYQPFIDAWINYTQKPENKDFSYSGLGMQLIAQGIGFDITKLPEPKSKADPFKKTATEIMKKVMKSVDKQSGMDAMMMTVVASGGDLSDYMNPTEIEAFKVRMKGKTLDDLLAAL